MLKAIGNIAKGILLSVFAVAAAPILAIIELIRAFSTFLG